MPLNPATLIDRIRRFSDETHAEFVGFPETPVEVAQRWAEALSAYFDELTLPALIPGATSLAGAALQAAMPPLVAPVPGAGPAALQAGFAAFTAALVPGALPAMAVPPPAPFVAPPLPPVTDATAAATTLASAVDLWARTGLSGVPPAPPVTPWS